MKSTDNIADAGKIIGKAGSKGWKVGDPITNLTKAGNVPSWNTVKARYWKNQAHYFPKNYIDDNLKLMRKGTSPILTGGQKAVLHHPFGRGGENFYKFFPMAERTHINWHVLYGY